MNRERSNHPLTLAMTRRRFIGLVGLGAGMSLLTACGPIGSSDNEGESGKTSFPHAASITWWGHVPMMVALEKEMFKEYDLDVTLEQIVASNDRLLALTGGSIAWSNLGSASVITQMAQDNKSFYWVANVDDSPGNQGVVVQPELEGWADLAGKKLAVPRNTDSEIMVYQLLEENGMSPQDLELIPLQANEIPGAFANGSIDAYAVWEPAFSDAMEGVPGSKVIGMDTDTPIYKQFGTATAPDVVIIRRDIVDEYPEIVRDKLLAAFFKGVDLVKTDPEEAAEIVHEKYFKMTIEETLEGINSFHYFGAAEQSDRIDNLLGTLNAVIDWQFEQERITTRPDPEEWLRRDLVPA